MNNMEKEALTRCTRTTKEEAIKAMKQLKLQMAWRIKCISENKNTDHHIGMINKAYAFTTEKYFTAKRKDEELADALLDLHCFIRTWKIKLLF